MSLTKDQVSLTSNVQTLLTGKQPEIYFQVGGLLIYKQGEPQEPSLTEVIAQILKELKAFQDKSEGRVCVQYYFSVEDRHFDVIGRIKDFDLEARYRLYNELPKWNTMFQSLGWEVRLIVVAESDEFGTDYDLKNV